MPVCARTSSTHSLGWTWRRIRLNRWVSFSQSIAFKIIFIISFIVDPWQDLEENYGKGGYVKLNKFKQTHPHLKVSLAIGGWNEGSLKYSKMAADADRRKRFVQNALSFIQRFGFDGLDLDWEYPTQRDGNPEDRENFSKLVIELKAAFKKHNLLLTSAIGAPPKIIDQAYEIKVLSNHLDFLHIMCYDYHGAWDKKVGPNAPLSSDDLLNVEYTIEHLINLGASPGKIVLGLPFYGRTFIEHADGTADEMGFQGPFTRENGFLGYNEICTTVQNDTWKLSWDAKTAQAYARQAVPDKAQTKVIAYDTARSIANKVRFGIRQELGGFMIWSLDTDDFLGKCPLDKDIYADFGNIEKQKSFNQVMRSRVNKNYPLLRTINEAAIIASEEWEKDRDSQNEVDSNDEPSGAGKSSVKYSSLLLAILCVNLYM